MSRILESFKVYISQSLSKNEVEIKMKRADEVDWSMEYNSQYCTPENLITVLKTVCTELLKTKGISEIAGYNLQYLIKECSGWIVDDQIVMEE